MRVDATALARSLREQVEFLFWCEPCMAKSNSRANQLAGETSPYLLQHMHNPVDWYPWGQAALDRALNENKVIFLSIGYSSCHWCHVMARESFSDEEVAATLNRSFISIKVDREERPDIDSIYMTALQIITHQAGWPVSMFLMPDTRPFFGATYLPARDNDRPGATGFLSLLEKISDLWPQDRDRVEQQAAQIVRSTRTHLRQVESQATGVPIESLTAAAHDALVQNFDAQWGGFGDRRSNFGQPKFPDASNLVFLLNRLRQNVAGDRGDGDERLMLQKTLDLMAAGGIRDHLGGGFHRYSVDRYWQIPHFEKMLCDNGQLATVYSEAYGLTKNPLYREVAEELVDFVLRELTDSGGAFYSALDAESEGEEGKYYRWDRAEVESALQPGDYSVFAAAFGLDEPPNLDGRYHVLNRVLSTAQLATKFDQSAQEIERCVDAACDRLLEIRSRRPRPRTDDKILAEWNGLMIRGIADTGRILERPDCILAAERAAEFILDQLLDADGRLTRVYGQGGDQRFAFLTDYAFLVNGLLGLHRATGAERWLQQATELTELQIEWFWDAEHGAFFFTAHDHEPLLVRITNLIDGAQPSGNSVSVENLVYLGTVLRNSAYMQKAKETFAAAGSLLVRAPNAAMRMLAAASASGAASD